MNKTKHAGENIQLKEDLEFYKMKYRQEKRGHAITLLLLHDVALVLENIKTKIDKFEKAIEENEKCSHENTVIWEPHLAGARKCKDCGRVNNPNRGTHWFYEKEE